MIKSKKLLIIPAIVISSVIVLASTISCQGDSKKYSVTLHAGTGHTINGQTDYQYNVNNKIDLEPTPDIKYGSSFTGWYNNKELKGSTITFPLTVSEDIELYASYNNMSGVHAITFNSNGGSDVPIYYINNEERIESKPITSKDGYRFNDWLDPNGDVVNFPYTPTQDIELTADWTKLDEKGGTLVLNTNGGTAPEGFTKKEGESYVFAKDKVETVATAPTTTKDSFNLEGWYTTSTFEEGTRVSFETPITILKGETIIWYAKWVNEPISSTYTITLNDAASKIRELKTSKLYYAPEATKKDHYTFVGWYLDVGCSTSPVTYPYAVKDNVNFYAKYSPVTSCTITLRDADNSTFIETITKDAGTTITSPFKYNGSYSEFGDFLGWSTDGTKTNIITYPYTIPNDETLTLNAVFDVTSANVNIYNSETNDKGGYDLIKSLGNIKTLFTMPSVVIADRVDDYTLVSLCTKPTTTEAGAVTISYPFDVSSLKDLITKDHELVLYAIWNVETRVYNVKLDYGTHTEYSAINIKYERSKEVDPSTFTKHSVVDEEITGWKDKVTGKLVTEKFNITSEKTFIAQWSYTHRKLKVYKEDGETLRDTYDHMPVKLKLSAVPQSTKSCYELTGYKVRGEEGVKSLDTIIDLNTDNDNPTEIIEVFGKQVATKLTIQYNNGTTVTGIDNKVINEQPLTFKVNTLPIATHQTYVITKFKYKDTEYELTGEINIDTSLSEDKQIVYAVWARDKYDVTFVDNDDGTTVLSTLKNVNVLTSDNIPVPTKSGKRFTGYSKTKDGDIVSLVGTKITAEDTKFYAHWENSTTEFTVTFNLGSLQSGATFVKTKGATVSGRIATITTSNSLAYDDCPTAACVGCSFLGWYTSEHESSTPIYPLTSSQNLYARFAPLSDYVTVSLNISGDGTFDGIGSSTTLLTVKKTTTEVTGDTWGDVKSKVPNATFTDAFKISSWKDANGTTLETTTTFKEDTFIYSVETEKIDTAANFSTDSWPTFCSIADQGLDELKTIYATEYAREDSTTGKVKDSFVGSTRSVTYNNKTYIVRVVGMQQDIDSTTNSKYYPLTFEFNESLVIDVYNSTNCSYANSEINKALSSGGYIYNKIQKSLINHIKTVSKSNYNGGSTETNSCKLFVPSTLELNFTKYGISYTGSFCYTYYSNAETASASTIRVKNYSGIGPCCYWCRDNNSGSYMIEYNGNGSENNDVSKVDVYRGIAPMFCVGLAE